MSIFHFCMCNFKKKIIYIIFLNIYIYIYIYIYKRVLRVLFPGVAVPVSDTRIFVSSVSRVHVSGDLVLLGNSKFVVCSSLSSIWHCLQIFSCLFFGCFNTTMFLRMRLTLCLSFVFCGEKRYV
jgi:hypothetical protein